MHRSSESIAALATALAKAQTELSNPEKSLTAIIRPDRVGGPERSFRYAPLSSGLDIVRKTLGKHEIAVLQTTAMDQPTRSVALTTMLTHSSGEWIASEWPVCPMSDMAAPHRMGAALTYARRYALFTLVGITGEDDLDAPDLNCQSLEEAAPRARTTPRAVASPPGSIGNVAELPGRGAGRGNDGGQGRAILTPQASAECRDRLVREIVQLPSEEAAGEWAREVLPLKNTLIARDARLVETAFAFRMSVLEEKRTGTESPSPTEIADAASTRQESAADAVAIEARQPSPGRIDNSLLAIPEPRRHRDKEHLKLVASKPCLICGRKPAEPHHLRFAQKPALGRKVSDEFAVPLCRLHHRELHRAPDEPRWWQAARIEPLKIARALWKASRSPRDAGAEVAGNASLPETRTSAGTEAGGQTSEQVGPSAPPASGPDDAAGVGK
jgi:ERF superfamily